jgi:uncharacterized cupin superfamily protein
LPNLNDPQFDEERDHDGFRALRARIGQQLGTERLGISLWELPPGEAAYPYHYHLAEEELVIVLAGTASLRTPDGWRDVAEGEVLSFPVGEDGAHQFANRTDGTVRLLAISTHGEPEIAILPDSGKLNASERLPGGGGLRKIFRLSDAVDYWDGEKPPS